MCTPSTDDANVSQERVLFLLLFFPLFLHHLSFSPLSLLACAVLEMSGDELVLMVGRNELVSEVTCVFFLVIWFSFDAYFFFFVGGE